MPLSHTKERPMGAFPSTEGDPVLLPLLEPLPVAEGLSSSTLAG
jgi:hypothetical protein